MTFPKPVRPNSKPFQWTQSKMLKAIKANKDMGSPYTEAEIRSSWSLARSLYCAALRSEGMKLRQIATEIGTCERQPLAILTHLHYAAKRRLKSGGKNTLLA